MKKYLSIGMLLISLSVNAQSWFTEMQKPDRNFFSIKKKADNYFKDEIRQAKYEAKHVGKSKQEAQEDEGVEGYKIYKRWEEFWKPRINSDGTFPASDAVYQAMKNWNEKYGNQVQSQGAWTAIGPFAVAPGAGWSPGIGRINGMTVNPQNSNEIYACAPAGGIWKSTTGGNNFTTTTDNLPSIGFTSVAVDPTNPNIVYAASGDGEAGDTYGLGVLKSTDAGATWNTTGLIWNLANARSCHKILLDPINPNIVFVATNVGLFKSMDGAATWTSVLSYNIFDLEFMPGNNTIMYAVSSSSFFKSVDNGQTFFNVSVGLPLPSTVSRFALTVTPANPDIVYLIAGSSTDNSFLGLYKSTDAGNTFSFITNQPNLMGWDMNGNDTGGQSWYTLTIAADPTDANHILTGGVNVWESFDGGQSFFINAHWVKNSTSYVHADIHFLDFVGGNLFAGTDGGLFKSTNAGGNWIDISQGLQVSQFYRFGTSTTDPNLMFGGAQDNGGIRMQNGSCDQWIGADGFENAVHPTNNNIVYGESQYGSIYKSTDKGNTYTGVSSIPGQGDWNTPFLLNNNGVLYVGYKDIWKSTNGGASFNKLTTTALGTLKFMAICKSAQNRLYATNGTDVYKINETNGLVTNITNGLMGVKSYLAVADNDPDKVYVTISGFTNGIKVYKSIDGGATWLNITGNLPNIPVTTIACDTTALEGVYIGTESGVFYRNNNSYDWQQFSNGLPKVIVNELEFNYATNKIRAATYGRGIWESNLYTQTVPDADFTQNYTIICPGKTVTFTDVSTEGPTSRNWNFPGGIPATDTSKTVTVTYPVAGFFDATLVVTNSSGSATKNKSNTVEVGVIMQSLPFAEGFESQQLPSGWYVLDYDNDGTTWQKSQPGGFSASSNSFKASNYYASNINRADDLVLANYDFTTLSNPELKFDVAYGKRTPATNDTLKVDYSLDCGLTWSTIYHKGGNQLKTSNSYYVNNIFVPTATQWRTEVVNLAAIANQNQVLIRFQNFSNRGQDIYIDNINIDVAAGISDIKNNYANVQIIPNPVVDVSTIAINESITLKTNNQLVVYNVLGKKIKTISIQKGAKFVSINKADFAEGFYFYELIVDEMVIAKGKFITK